MNSSNSLPESVVEVSPKELSSSLDHDSQIQDDFHSPISVRNQWKGLTLVLGGMLLGVVVSLGIGYWMITNVMPGRPTHQTEATPATLAEQPSVRGEDFKSWSNCKDTRDLVTTSDRIYIGCLGGVLGIDRVSGMVVDQLNRFNGLRNETVTSLVRHEGVLYIGTQHGVVIYHEATKKFDYLDESKGLPSNKNIKLLLDKDYLWIATFEGVARYNTRTFELVNYKGKVAQGNGESIPYIYQFQGRVYALVLANAYSRGGIAEYRYETDSWTWYGPEYFDQWENPDRIDLLWVSQVDGKVLTHTYGNPNRVWSLDPQMNRFMVEPKWEERINAMSGVNKSIVRYEGASRGTSYFSAAEQMFSYEQGMVTQLSLTRSLNDVIRVGDNEFWMVAPHSREAWVRVYNPGSLALSKSWQQPRPLLFYRLLAVINDRAYISTDWGVVSYSFDSNSFEEVMQIPATGKNIYDMQDGLTWFAPVSGESSIFIGSQLCGMGCSEPTMLLFDFKSQTTKAVPMFPESLISPTFTKERDFYPLISFVGLSNQNQPILQVGNESGGYVALDLATLKWNTNFGAIETIGECNRNYTYSNAEGFQRGACEVDFQTAQTQLQLRSQEVITSSALDNGTELTTAQAIVNREGTWGLSIGGLFWVSAE